MGARPGSSRRRGRPRRAHGAPARPGVANRPACAPHASAAVVPSKSDPSGARQAVQGRPGRGLGRGPQGRVDLGVDHLDDLARGRRPVRQDRQHLAFAEGAVVQVVAHDRVGVLRQLRPVPRVQHVGAEVEHAAQAVEVGRQVPVGVGDHRGAAPEDVVAGQQRPGAEPERQVVAAVPRRRDRLDRQARQVDVAAVGQHVAPLAGHVRGGGVQARPEVVGPRRRGRGVVDVVVGDQHGGGPGVAVAQDGLDGGEVVGVVGARVDDRGHPGPHRVQHVGVGPVQRHRRGVGGEHPRGHLVEAGHGGQLPERGQVPAGARVGRGIGRQVHHGSARGRAAGSPRA